MYGWNTTSRSHGSHGVLSCSYGWNSGSHKQSLGAPDLSTVYGCWNDETTGPYMRCTMAVIVIVIVIVLIPGLTVLSVSYGLITTRFLMVYYNGWNDLQEWCMG